MQHFFISAEHVSEKDIEKIADEVDELPGIEIMAIGTDPVFDQYLCLVFYATVNPKEQVRDIVWKYNNGAWCEQTKITEDKAEEYC